MSRIRFYRKYQGQDYYVVIGREYERSLKEVGKGYEGSMNRVGRECKWITNYL